MFDFIVIATATAIALVPASGPFAVPRAFGVLRVLRLATKMPSLHKVVAGLLAAISGLEYVGAVMGLIIYVSGVTSYQFVWQRLSRHLWRVGPEPVHIVPSDDGRWLV